MVLVFALSTFISILSVERDMPKSVETGLLDCGHASLTFGLTIQPILINFPRKHLKTAFIIPQVSLKMHKRERKEGRKRVRKAFKFLCRLTVYTLRDKHQQIVRSGSPLSFADRFQGYRGERNISQFNDRLLKLKE